MEVPNHQQGRRPRRPLPHRPRGRATRPAANRRCELLDEVGGHIAAARAALDPETEAGIRTVLERLGDPADIAAEARERFGVQAKPARPTIPWLEVATLAILVLVPVTVWLGIAMVIPLLGWLVGLALLWRSRRWTTHDKRIGTLLAALAALTVGVLNVVVHDRWTVNALLVATQVGVAHGGWLGVR